jgi:hypothetical protein
VLDLKKGKSMHKISVGMLFLFISFAGFAQELTCLEKLLPYNRHSGLHNLTKDEWYDGKESLDAESIKSGLKYLLSSKLLCKTTDVVIKIEPVCSFMVADLAQSNACFVFTNVGHFLINRDSVRNTNFIFSKDKKFSETIE